MGSRPCGKLCCPRGAPRGRAMPPYVGGYPLRPGCGRCLRLQVSPVQAPAMPGGDSACWRRPLDGALAMAGRPLDGGLSRSRLPLTAGLAMGGRPCMGAGRGWRPLLLAAFAAKMQQEYIEQFYMILSYHMQFKTNLLLENLGSDTIIGKPQRIRMEKMKEVKRPPL
ncbi:hypothetical protein BHM03_00059454 [Ensete ventricosum]|nr:hypothetical protein BHM03_00059454 [Ensete ventricosum]